MGDKIFPKLDRHQGCLNQNDPLSSITAPPNVLTSRPLVQRNSAQSSYSRCISNHKSQASYQTTDAPKETRGKFLNPVTASFKHCFLSGKKSKDPLGHDSSNPAPQLATSIPVSHADTTKYYESPEEGVQHFPPPQNIPETPASPNVSRLGSPGSPMPRCATAFSEPRQAISIRDLPEELRTHVLATPEHFHDIIVRAYNNPPRRLPGISARGMSASTPRLVATLAKTYCGYWSAPLQVLLSSRWGLLGSIRAGAVSFEPSTAFDCRGTSALPERPSDHRRRSRLDLHGSSYS